jgi:glycogen operon protein
MMDMVSYDRKHNEANGEDNRDGNDLNCSWNCGEEGKSRRKKVRKLRIRQIKNAMCMLLLGQGTPLIFMGDEFGNTQNGNNNPYCQDNAVTWLDWRKLESEKELYDFWRSMIEIRKKHPILHMNREMRMIDYISCGYPDLSYHGQNAWRAQLESYNRHVGIMYCGKYTRLKSGEEDAFCYLAMNMYWEPRTLGLPKLPSGMKWERLVCTADDIECHDKKAESSKEEEDTVYITVPARSVGFFTAVNKEKV